MQKTFSVSIPAESRNLRPDKNGTGQVSYTVTNNKSNPARCRVEIVVKDGAKDDWFSLSGDQECGFGSEEVQQIKVQAAIPSGTPAGTYGFRIDAVNVANPQEDFTEGDTVSIAWQAKERAPRKPLPKSLIPTAAVIGAVIALGIILSMIPWGGGNTPESVLKQSYAAFEEEDWKKFFNCLAPDLQDRVGAHALAHIAFGRPTEIHTRQLTYTVKIPVTREVQDKDGKTSTVEEFVNETRARSVLSRYYSPTYMIRVKAGAVDFFAEHGAPQLTKTKLEEVAQLDGLMQWAMLQFVRLGDQKQKFFEDAMKIIVKEYGQDYKNNESEFFLPVLRNPAELDGVVKFDDVKHPIASWSDRLEEPRRFASQVIFEKVENKWLVSDMRFGPDLPSPSTGDLEHTADIEPRKTEALMREMDRFRDVEMRSAPR